MTLRRRRGGGDAQVPGERDQLVLGELRRPELRGRVREVLAVPAAELIVEDTCPAEAAQLRDRLGVVVSGAGPPWQMTTGVGDDSPSSAPTTRYQGSCPFQVKRASRMSTSNSFACDWFASQKDGSPALFTGDGRYDRHGDAR